MKNKNTASATATLTKNLVGRPRATVKFPTKAAFTRKQLYNMNRCLVPLTCINYLTEAVKSGLITRLAEKRMSGKPGKPQYRYIQTALLATIPIALTEPSQVVEVPIVTTEATPVAPVEAVSAPVEAEPVLA